MTIAPILLKPSASLALQAAIFTTLSASLDLTTLTNGIPRVYDAVPPMTPYPYVTFGQTIERDWSTSTEDGHEHLITLQVWSRAPGRSEVHKAAAIIRGLLHLAPLTVTGFHLVDIRHQFTEARREPDGETYRAIIRFRAVTEPV